VKKEVEAQAVETNNIGRRIQLKG